MSSPSACVSPGPRKPDLVGHPLPNSHSSTGVPPFFRNLPLSDRWETKAPIPISQSRPYVSPDPSPLDQQFDHPQTHNELGLSLSNHPREFPHPGRPPEPEGTMLQQQSPPNRFFTNPPPPFWQHTTHNGNHGDHDPWFNPIMLPQTNKSKKNKNQKKVEGKQPTFLTKLFGLLEQPEYHHIIRWDETGEAIIIENPEELAEKILPVVYRQSRFASFSRQLNIYGFNRKLSLRHVERGIYDPDASTWSHPFLKRHSTKAEILSFKRRVPPRPTQAQKRRMNLQEEGLSPTSSEHSMDFHSPPDAYQHHLLPDVDEDKPFVFTHPRGSFVPQMLPYQSSLHAHAPPPEYHAYEPTSPTAFEFDYSTPEEDGRSPSVPVPQQRPFEVSRELFKIQPLSFYNDNAMGNDRSNMVPHTAPANTTSFPPLPIKVTQQHIRTRSVQGEPPSAMLYSPSSPFNPSSWLTGDVPEPQHNYLNLKKEESISPTNLPQRQLSDGYAPHGHNIMNSSNDTSAWWNNRRGLGGSEYSGSPQSLPNDFIPGSSGGSSNSLILPQIQTRPPPSIGGSMDTQTFSALSPDSPMTISPGIYQSGFSFPPSPKAPSSFGKIINRQERRATIASHSAPYQATSPRNKIPPLLATTLSTGNNSLRSIASRRGSPSQSSALGLRVHDFGNETKDAQEEGEENEALPSASIKFEDKHPFEGILGGEAIVE
ncbi:hypothetical protein I302_104786 [Kwoniella bestiolae CBS 10118]|uniref:HSF-type DNA-binding domain-containing protein n=1 Tax=Kwoniella bestiolae CBS 10118 TaxID=1296100 RepID=A0A1B9FRS4_9TREE|nr:hypothetical protein I302_09145 [Kwoniella bestiolae CBS 10118]OCF21466.1 hypothetical protein I302_09145 [Kwoniella bestiolae CBS 10118]